MTKVWSSSDSVNSVEFGSMSNKSWEVTSGNHGFSTINLGLPVDYSILAVQFLWDILQIQSFPYASQSLSCNCYLMDYVEEN